MGWFFVVYLNFVGTFHMAFPPCFVMASFEAIVELDFGET